MWMNEWMNEWMNQSINQSINQLPWFSFTRISPARKQGLASVSVVICYGVTNISMTAPFYSWPSKAQVRLGSFSPQIRSVSPISAVRYIFFVPILTNFKV